MAGVHMIFSLCFLTAFTTEIQGQLCMVDPSTAVVEHGDACLEPLLEGFTSHSTKRFPANFYTLSGWEKYCAGHAQLEPCLRGVFSTCGEDNLSRYVSQAWRELQDRWVKTGFFPRPDTCEGGLPSASTKQVYAALGQDCLEKVTDTVDSCVDEWLEEVEFVTADDLTKFHRWAHSTFQCGVGLVPARCGEKGRALSKFILEHTFPAEVTATLTEKDLDQPLSSNELLSTKRTTTGVFGDPHLRLYKHKGLVTCQATDWRPYVANEYFVLEGESTLVGILPASKATSLTKFKIKFLDGELTYTASNGNLPLTLSNNATSGKAGEHPVNLVPGHKGVRLTAPSLGLIMEATRWKKSFLFAMRASDNLYRKSHGLLISGCQKQETIDIQETAMRRRRDADTLTTMCEEACVNMEDEGDNHYHSACIFDCNNTQDGTVANMTAGFQASLQIVDSMDSELDLQPEPDTSSGTRSLLSIQFSLILITLAISLS